MKKPYILTLFFCLSTIVLLVLFLNARGTITYERASYKQNTLNLEATDFCLRMALAYCANDTQTLQAHTSSDSLPASEFFENSNTAIKRFNQTRYVSDPADPYATYAIEYVIPAPDGGAVRSVLQTMLVKKDLDSSMWTFAVLALE